MDMLTRSIITDEKKGKEEYQALYYRDFEVDKLFFLISRLIRSHLTAQTAGINNIQAHTMWWLAKNLESISDCAKNLSKDFSPDIEEIYNEIEQYYLDCAKAYFKNDKSLADEMIEKRGKLLDKCDKLNNEKKYLLKETVNHSRNIAKIILDTEN
jgi:phosphate uptake regulator